jgi:hypothetical protein
MALLATMLADERTFSNLSPRGTQRSTMLAQSSKSTGFLHLEMHAALRQMNCPESRERLHGGVH